MQGGRCSSLCRGSDAENIRRSHTLQFQTLVLDISISYLQQVSSSVQRKYQAFIYGIELSIPSFGNSMKEPANGLCLQNRLQLFGRKLSSKSKSCWFDKEIWIYFEINTLQLWPLSSRGLLCLTHLKNTHRTGILQWLCPLFETPFLGLYLICSGMT